MIRPQGCMVWQDTGRARRRRGAMSRSTGRGDAWMHGLDYVSRVGKGAGQRATKTLKQGRYRGVAMDSQSNCLWGGGE
jgi:hypothetical protein